MKNNALKTKQNKPTHPEEAENGKFVKWRKDSLNSQFSFS